MKDSLFKIYQDLLKFKKLEIAKTCTQPVIGRGNPKAKILFIGEAPGAKEDLEGKPFIGRSGKLLDTLIENAKINPEDIYITNIVKFRPPENRDPTAEEKEKCLPFLIREIEVIKPEIIATLGRHSLNFFYPKVKISEVHGTKMTKSETWRKDQIYFPLYHPAVALYNPNKKKELQQDINKLSNLISNGT
jgi:DNA polymerase